MNTTLQSIFNELEQQRTEVLALVKDLSAEQFNHSPSPAKWSIGQILTHILVAEQLSFGYMKKKALGIDQLKNSGIQQAVLFEILKVSQRIPSLKFKAPKVVLANTPTSYTLPELTQRWEAHRSELKNFLEKIEDKNVRKLIYKHPVVGRLDGVQAITFFREHIIHHLPQIKHLLNLNSAHR